MQISPFQGNIRKQEFLSASSMLSLSWIAIVIPHKLLITVSLIATVLGSCGYNTHWLSELGVLGTCASGGSGKL